jgi:23S rRNA (uracil1939-C5)-methyltransferase
VEASIVDLTHDARGVADVDGRRLFVAGALPGEHVLIAPRRRRRRYEEADLKQILEPAASRVEPRCEYFGRCGGCALQHLDYQAQVRFKQTVAEEALARIAGMTPERWLEPVESPPWGYRRRARLGVRYVEGKERVLVGFRERAAAYVTDMARCPVLAPPMDALVGPLAELIGASTLERRVPQVEVAVGDNRAAIVLRVLDPPAPSDLELFKSFGERWGLDVYIQPGGPGTVAPVPGTSPEPLLYRLPFFGLELEFLPTDFVQVNAAVNARLVEAAVEAADLRPTDRVLDLFCGLGNMSLALARRASEVLGVEGEAGLVARAARNAERNGIHGARFVTADLNEAGWGFYREPWDVAVLDPPRTGAEAAAAELLRLAPRRIVYVSCHPATLARDAKTLIGGGRYTLDSARIFDMFPHTHHVEVMTVFSRR